MSKNQYVRKSNKTFNPDELVTTISQAIYRDLSNFTAEHEVEERALKFVIDKQGKQLLKKYASPLVDQSHLVSKTFKKFLDVNEHMSKFVSIDLPPVGSHVSRKGCRKDNILLRARALMYSTLSNFTEDEFFRECKHSSGSSIGVKYTDTSMEAKFTYPLTITKSAKPIFDRYLSFDSSTKQAVDTFNSIHPLGEKYLIEKGSRATTVDKDNTIRRMIAIEPTGNMFLQQGLMEMMYKRMKRVGLDVATLPETHKKRAMEASISGLEATIDFSSASDCVSMGLLEWLLPPKWFWYFSALRCDEMTVNGDQISLNMSSTMGNAVTFPLETLVFWTLAHATRLSMTENNALLVNYEDKMLCSVFGDDCIVPTPIASDFIEVCESFGFIVNKEKSFYGTESFRESCGGDYLAGFDVRPYFLKAPTNCRLSSLEPWLYIIFNSVLKKYISYFGTLNYVYYQNFFRAMSSIFGRFNLEFKIVPPFLPDDSGLLYYNDIDRLLSNYKFNISLVKRLDHGVLTYRFLRFNYRTKRSVSDDIRYANWLKRSSAVSDIDDHKLSWFNHELSCKLKKPARQVRSRPLFSKIRRLGGYIVARGETSRWTIPDGFGT